MLFWLLKERKGKCVIRRKRIGHFTYYLIHVNGVRDHLIFITTQEVILISFEKEKKKDKTKFDLKSPPPPLAIGTFPARRENASPGIYLYRRSEEGHWSVVGHCKRHNGEEIALQTQSTAANAGFHFLATVIK